MTAIAHETGNAARGDASNATDLVPTLRVGTHVPTLCVASVLPSASRATSQLSRHVRQTVLGVVVPWAAPRPPKVGPACQAGSGNW